MPKKLIPNEANLEINENVASAVASKLVKIDKVIEQKNEIAKTTTEDTKNKTEGIRMAVDYLIQEEASGKIIISDCGIRKNEFNDLLTK